MEQSQTSVLTYNISDLSPDHLKQAILHNKFGGLCFKGNTFDKAIDHFQKAIELIGDLAFTNIYQNMGNVYAQKNQIEDAVKYYQTVIKYSPHNPENKDAINDEYMYNNLINSKEAYIDAYTNLAVMYLKLGDIEKGLEYCQKATELDPENHVALVNLGDIMRQVLKFLSRIKE